MLLIFLYPQEKSETRDFLIFKKKKETSDMKWIKLLVIRQKGQSQNGGKKKKHAKSSEKRIFLTL